MFPILKIIIAYLIGSIPFGLILTKLFTDIDIRKIGSGNIGSTNVLRTGKTWLAVLTLALDILKGFVAVKIFQNNSEPAQLYFIAGAAVLGHIYPCWLKFRGGKGVATYLGVVLAINWYVAAIAVAVWLMVAFITRYSSLAAIVAIIVVPPLAFFLESYNFAFLCFILGVIIISKHQENIERLRQGTESKIGGQKKDAGE